MPAHTFENTDAVDAVSERIDESWVNRCPFVTAYRATLTDGTTVRLFTLEETADTSSRESFEICCRQWVQYSDRSGVTPVLDRGTEPTPWIAVADVGTALSACRKDLSVGQIRTVVETVTETLRGTAQPHLGIRPGVIRVHQDDDTFGVSLDWAITRRCQESYQPPELHGTDRFSQSAGGVAADIYSLGAVLQEMLDSDSIQPELEAVCATAMADDPVDRYHSMYAFKRALLFQSHSTQSDTVGPDSSVNRERTESQTAGTSTGQRTESDRSGQQTVPADDEQPPKTDESAQTTEPDRRRLSRRNTIAAGALGVMAVGGLGVTQLSGTSGIADPSTGFDVSYDPRGLLAVRYTGEQALDQRTILLTGLGFTSSPELYWHELADNATIADDGETVVLAADPAYDIEIVDGDGELLARETGPAAGDSRPDDRRQPVPQLSFSIERQRESALEIRYEDGPAVPATHLLLHDRAEDSQRVLEQTEPLVEPGAQFTYDGTAATVIGIEWAPPYVEETAVLVEHRGRDRPLDRQLTGVRASQSDNTNNRYAADIRSPAVSPTESWTFDGFQADSAGSETTITAVDGRLFVNGSHRLYALDARDGTVLWRRYLGTQRILSPTVADGRVFVGSVDNDRDPCIGAVDVETGSVDWRFSTDADVLFSPVVTPDIVATGSLDSMFFLDPSTGEQSLASLDYGQSTRTAIDPGLLYAISRDGTLRAHRPDEIEWEVDDVVQIAPTAADETVYVIREQTLDATGGERRALVAVDRTDGTTRWEFGLSSRRTLPPVVADGTVILVEGSGNIHGIESNSGAQSWQVTADGDVWAVPVIASETLYVGSTAESVQAFDIADGTQRWRLSLPTAPDDVAVVDDTLYVVGQDRQLHCFRSAEESASASQRPAVRSGSVICSP